MSVDTIALALGYICLSISALALVCLCVIGVTVLFNRATHAVVACYGGYKTFKMFREWYHSQDKP